MTDNESEAADEMYGVSSEPEEGYTNVFESVWVKVEVEELDQSSHDDDTGVQLAAERPSKPKMTAKKTRKKLLKCDKCNFTTTHSNSFRFHLLSHRGLTGEADPLTCELCDYTTKYTTALKRHCIVNHQGPLDNKGVPEYKCDFENCKYVTHYSWNLSSHKRKHKLEKPHKCSKCDYQTSYRHNIIKHAKIHNDDVFYKCDKCAFITKFEGHIARHLAVIHNEVTEGANQCDLCDFSTKLKWRLNLHKQRSLKNKPITCAYCSFETLYTCEFKKHRELHIDEVYKKKKTSKVEEKVEAKVGEKIEAKRSKVLEESSSKMYTLDPDCLDWNKIQVLEQGGKRPFACVMCPYASPFKAAVQRHFQRTHTGAHNRPYRCLNCDFATKTKESISIHIKRSRVTSPLSCDACDYRTSYKCQLAEHRRSHYEHRCHLCSFACRFQSGLKRHQYLAHGGGLEAARPAALPARRTPAGRKALTIVSEDKIQSLKVSVTSDGIMPVDMTNVK